MSLLEIQQLKKSYGCGSGAANALRGLDLVVEAGEMLAVRGASGSGKTTLLNLIAGFDAPDAGKILFEGVDVVQLDDGRRTRFRRRHLGFVFQQMNLLPTMTALENIALQKVLNGDSFGSARLAARRLLEEARLGDRADAFPNQLSGGEQQRVAILRALVHEPKLLLLDEPTSCLDSENARLLFDLLVSINQESRMTVVFATHDAQAAMRARRVVTISDGVSQ